jgi:hypothetical protein
MAQQKTNNEAPLVPAGAAVRGAWSSPQTDPTNPYHQEAAGVWVANERAADWRVTEPGLTEAERSRRNYGGLPPAENSSESAA